MKRPIEADYITNDIYDLAGYSKSMARYVTYLEEKVLELEADMRVHLHHKGFKVGDRVRIEKRLHNHQFSIGQVVSITRKVYNDDLPFLCESDGGRIWWISEQEASVCA